MQVFFFLNCYCWYIWSMHVPKCLVIVYGQDALIYFASYHTWGMEIKVCFLGALLGYLGFIESIRTLFFTTCINSFLESLYLMNSNIYIYIERERERVRENVLWFSSSYFLLLYFSFWFISKCHNYLRVCLYNRLNVNI